ncbi:MAG TPA: 5-formyltetrahydrofolate cyclo-ligase [Actinomycetota bacterium]|nr:5-formyltetrahydrofolate cyclo-ligase [Actinomycetota bacterium]
MNSADLKRAKREVRHRVLAERDAMPASDRARRSGAVAELALALPEVIRARTLMAFWSFGSELDTAPLLTGLHERGVTLVLPRVVDGELEPRSYRPGDAMTVTTFGALEPVQGSPLDPREIDAIAVPAVAFDREGRRVGYGGGFYDRFLPRTRNDAVRIGIAFGCQLLPPGDALPSGAFDLRVDLVVTETGVLRITAST